MLSLLDLNVGATSTSILYPQMYIIHAKFNVNTSGHWFCVPHEHWFNGFVTHTSHIRIRFYLLALYAHLLTPAMSANGHQT